ncbi:Cytochrome b5 reductase 4, partial [Nowakowskiella sp. JEL0078]
MQFFKETNKDAQPTRALEKSLESCSPSKTLPDDISINPNFIETDEDSISIVAPKAFTPPDRAKSSRPSTAFLTPLSAHDMRPVTISSKDVFPMLGGPQRAASSSGPSPRRKVALEPGHSAMDWSKLMASTDLTGGLPLRRITVSELELHCTKGDCWMSIQGKVYNVTLYIKFHPGGVGQLMRGAGKDASALFLKVHPW